MSSNSLRQIVDQLRTAAAGQPGAALTDGELLTQFLTQRDEEAFASLVGRHAPMVWGVCCRHLHNAKDAEDAFQAAFLVLIQKAATIIPREMVGNWLYGVAQKTAVRLRASSAKRGWREIQVNELPEPVVAETHANEMLSQLDEELTRLPERSRALIVLCDLEGHTRKEVAKQLGWPEGTVASGLVRARELLAKRLTRRGLAVSGASLAATLAQSQASADIPPSVVISTINVATLFASGKAAGVISGDVSTLTQGVLKTMFLKKILTTSVAVLALGVVAITGGSLAIGQGERKPGVEKEAKPPVVEKPVEPAVAQKPVQKEPEIAWGKEVGGLQAGLGYLPGDTGVYQHGDLNNRKTVNLVVRVRNVSKEVVKFQYIKQFLDEKIPAVTDADGKPVSQAKGTQVLGEHGAVDVALKPGAEIILESRMHGAALPFELIPAWSGVTNSNYQPLCLGFGKFRLQFEQVFGNSSAGKIKLDPVLEKLATGKLDLEVKVPGPLQIAPKKESKIAWGKEFKGLQSGISILNSEAIHIGDRLQTVVKLRNVSDKPIKVSSRPMWMGYPNVIDSLGKRVNLTRQPVPSDVEIFEATLKPGEVVEAGQSELLVAKIDQNIEIRSGLKLCAIHVDPGKYQVISYGFDGEFVNLATGTMEFEVKSASNEKPKPVVKIYTPDELIRVKITPENHLDKYTVEFKVLSVAKPMQFKQAIEDPGTGKLRGDANVPFVLGHGPDDISLLPNLPKKGLDEHFSVNFTPKVIDIFQRIGISDLAKHLEGKTIRVTGTLFSVESANSPEPLFRSLREIVIEDISQIESVK